MYPFQKEGCGTHEKTISVNVAQCRQIREIDNGCFIFTPGRPTRVVLNHLLCTVIVVKFRINASLFLCSEYFTLCYK